MFGKKKSKPAQSPSKKNLNKQMRAFDMSTRKNILGKYETQKQFNAAQKIASLERQKQDLSKQQQQIQRQAKQGGRIFKFHGNQLSAPPQHQRALLL